MYMHKRVSITSEMHMYRHLLLIRQFSTEVKAPTLGTYSEHLLWAKYSPHQKAERELSPAFSCLPGVGTPDICKAYLDAVRIHPAILMPLMSVREQITVRAQRLLAFKKEWGSAAR